MRKWYYYIPFITFIFVCSFLSLLLRIKRERNEQKKEKTQSFTASLRAANQMEAVEGDTFNLFCSLSRLRSTLTGKPSGACATSLTREVRRIYASAFRALAYSLM